MLISYMRDLEKRPFGIVVADKVNSEDSAFKFGWAICHPKDSFSKQMAKKIAINRLHNIGHIDNLKKHSRVNQFDLNRFLERCKKYYKIGN